MKTMAEADAVASLVRRMFAAFLRTGGHQVREVDVYFGGAPGE
jgi:hypothetical protein